jgi:outer membrane protein
VDVQRTRLEQVESQLQVAKRRFEVGETARADVTRWKSEVAASVQALVVAEGKAELSRRALERLTQVPDIDGFVAPESVAIPEGEREELLDLAIQERPELASLARQKNAGDLWVKIEKGAWLPELEAVGQYFQQKALFPSQDWISLTLSLKVPIYDGGLTAARVAKAKEDLVELQTVEQEVGRAVRDQVDAAAIAHKAAVAAFEAAEVRQASSREAYRQVERAYRVGEASATDLLVATTDVTDAEVAFIIARWQRELQAIALRHAVGLSPLPDLDLDAYREDETER